MKRSRPAVAGLAAASTLVLVIGVAAPASAVITVNGDEIEGDGADDNVTVSCVAGNLQASGVGPGDPCADLEAIFVDPGGGEDSVNLSSVTAAAFPALDYVLVDTDEVGADEVDGVTGSPLPDQIIGGSSDILVGAAGNDLITGGETVSGGPGDDTIFEFLGSGPATGGDGDDRFVQFAPPGGLDGGLGTDSWEIDFDQAQVSIALPLTFTFTPSGMVLTAPSGSAVLRRVRASRSSTPRSSRTRSRRSMRRPSPGPSTCVESPGSTSSPEVRSTTGCSAAPATTR